MRTKYMYSYAQSDDKTHVVITAYMYRIRFDTLIITASPLLNFGTRRVLTEVPANIKKEK